MADWAKIKFYYETMLGSLGSTLSADTTAAETDVNNIHNMLESNMWLSGSAASPQHITYDAGAGNSRSADYLAILGHNLKTAGATIVLQHSSDNFTADVNDAFTPFAPGADTVILKEFTAPAAKRYWRLRISGHNAAPYMAICVWGMKTELDYATASFDPHRIEVRSNVNLTQGGYLAGVHTMYSERRLDLKFEGSDQALYGKLKNWFYSNGLRNIFIAWDTSNSPDEVYLMRPEPGFHNPFANGGATRDISLSFRGRKE